MCFGLPLRETLREPLAEGGTQVLEKGLGLSREVYGHLSEVRSTGYLGGKA